MIYTPGVCVSRRNTSGRSESFGCHEHRTERRNRRRQPPYKSARSDCAVDARSQPGYPRLAAPESCIRSRTKAGAWPRYT